MFGRRLSRLKVVPIGEPLPPRMLTECCDTIDRALCSVIECLEIVPYELPRLQAIEVSLLTGALDQHVGGHILAITHADLYDGGGDDFSSFIFGGKDTRNDVAVVSTRRLSGRSREITFSRLLKVALHELGHNFGLGHHYSFEGTDDGGFCPMSKGDYNGYGERGYVRAVIDGRGLSFCERCKQFLRRLGPAR